MVLFESNPDERAGTWWARCDVSLGVFLDSSGSDVGSCNSSGAAVESGASAGHLHVWAEDVLLFSGPLVTELRSQSECECGTQNALGALEEWPHDPCQPILDHWGKLGCEVDVATCDSSTTTCEKACSSGEGCVCRRVSAPNCDTTDP